MACLICKPEGMFSVGSMRTGNPVYHCAPLSPIHRYCPGLVGLLCVSCFLSSHFRGCVSKALHCINLQDVRALESPRGPPSSGPFSSCGGNRLTSIFEMPRTSERPKHQEWKIARTTVQGRTGRIHRGGRRSATRMWIGSEKCFEFLSSSRKHRRHGSVQQLVSRLL